MPSKTIKIYKMPIECTRLIPSTKFATVSLIMLLPLDALLLLATVFSITCVVAKKLKKCLHNPSTPASRKGCVPSNSWIATMKRNLTMTKPRLLFFIYFQKSTSRISQRNFDDKTLKDLKNYFQGHYNANPPKRIDRSNDPCNDKGPASHCNQNNSTHCEDEDQDISSQYGGDCFGERPWPNYL